MTEKNLLIPEQHTKDYVFNGHHGTGPSGAHRWLDCTASLEATREFLETLTPNQQAAFADANSAARQGTTAHAAGEARVSAMIGGITPQERDDTLLQLSVAPPAGEDYDDEMERHVNMYVDFLQQYLIGDDPSEILLEQRLSAVVELEDDGGLREINGSADAVALPTESNRTLTVIDYKHGTGDVEVEGNPQVRIYGIGALSLVSNADGEIEGVDTIEYVIVQPRSGGIKTWSEPLESLLDWRDNTLSPALSRALLGVEGGATFNPTKKACEWCPVRGSCPALADSVMDGAAELFDAVVEAELIDGLPSMATTLDDASLGKLLEQAMLVAKVADDMKAEAQRRLHRGRDVPGFHLVSYSPPRVWSGEAEEALETNEALWAKKLLSPTQALSTLKKAGASSEDISTVEDLIDTPDKKPVIGSVTDRRKAWEGDAPEAMFAKQ